MRARGTKPSTDRASTTENAPDVRSNPSSAPSKPALEDRVENGRASGEPKIDVEAHQKRRTVRRSVAPGPHLARTLASAIDAQPRVPLAEVAVRVRGAGELVLESEGGHRRFEGDEIQLWRPVHEALEAGIRHASDEPEPILKKLATRNDRLGFWWGESFGIVLREALVNAVESIRKTPAQTGRIEVHASKAGDRLLLEVIDEGVGLARVDRRKVTHRQYTTKRNSTLTGIGLHQSRQFVEQILGGKLTLLDRQTDLGGPRGAALRISIPL